jgi:hypothetical protein
MHTLQLNTTAGAAAQELLYQRVCADAGAHASLLHTTLCCCRSVACICCCRCWRTAAVAAATLCSVRCSCGWLAAWRRLRSRRCCRRCRRRRCCCCRRACCQLLLAHGLDQLQHVCHAPGHRLVRLCLAQLPAAAAVALALDQRQLCVCVCVTTVFGVLVCSWTRVVLVFRRLYCVMPQAHAQDTHKHMHGRW